MKRRIDVSNCQQTKAGHYILAKDMIPDHHGNAPEDYRDTATDRVIWHVARNKRTGIVVASEGETYNKQNWESLWLR